MTRLLGQSPAGLSATGDSDTRNYYDMISARQEIDLRPQLERLDRLILRSAGVDPAALTFEFRPLWQMDAAAKATIALQKAQATQIYAGPEPVARRHDGAARRGPTRRGRHLSGRRGDLYGGGTGECAEDPLGEARRAPRCGLPTISTQTNCATHKGDGWAEAGGVSAPPLANPPAHRPGGTPKAKPSGVPNGILGQLGIFNPMGTASAAEIDPEEETRGRGEESFDPTAEIRIERYASARSALKEIDPHNQELFTLTPPDYVPSEADVQRLEASARAAVIRAQREKADVAGPNQPPAQTTSAEAAGKGPFNSRLPDGSISLGPPGFSVKVSGRSAQERGNSYESAIRQYLGTTKPTSSGANGDLKPDRVLGDHAFEVKYSDDFSSSIYNPEIDIGFTHEAVERNLAQARRYEERFAGRITYFTNNEALARAYTQLFKDNGVSRCRFVVIPAVR